MKNTSLLSMTTALFLSALTIMPMNAKAAASALVINGDGRGGGDVVSCSNDPQTSCYSGLYNLDYLLTRKDDFNENPEEKFKFAQNVNEIVGTIAKKLNDVSPAASKSLKDFMATVEVENWSQNDNPNAIYRVWVPAPRLLDYTDEDFITDVPKNCYKTSGERNISQIILREDVNSTVIYHYNRQLFTELKGSPLQLSYLLVHEWLRDFTVHATVIQKVNAYLHSTNFFQSQGYENASAIKRMGLLFDADSSREPVVQLMDFDAGVNSNGTSGLLKVKVSVKNITYHKYVAVYYSLDGGEWTELPLTYERPLSYGFEQWSVSTDFARSGSSVEFAIKYVAAGQIYWDNNNYKNYRGVFRYPTVSAKKK